MSETNLKKENVQLLKVAAIFLLIGLLLGAMLVYAQSPDTFTISSGVYPGAATYTFYTDGSTYYAKDAYGAIAVSSTNATYALQSLLDAATSGIKIFVKDGTYSFTNGIKIQKSYITITGSGKRNTILDFSSAGSGNLFTINDPSGTRIERIEISHMSLKGRNSASYPQTAIYVNNSKNMRFIDLEIYYFMGTDQYAIRLYKGGSAVISQCHLWSNNANILVDGGSSNTNNILTENYFFASASATTWQVSIQSGASLTRITNNLFEGSLYRVLIQANNVIFSANSFEANSGAVDLNLAASNCTVVGNCFTNTVSITGSSNYVAANAGFVTEKSGTATISASTSVTFNHGLAGTPTFVFASFNSTVVDGWTWTATSTQITITVTPSGTYTVYWYARYQP